MRSEVLYVRTDGALLRAFGGEVLLATREGEEIYRLDTTAGAIWRLLERPSTTRELLDALGRDYEAPRDVMEGDVARLLTGLIERGLVLEVADVDD
jgi:hypothetical protein